MRSGNKRRLWRHCRSVAFSSATIGALTFAGYQLHFNNATVVLLLILVVVLQSLTGGVIPSLIAATVAAACLDYFFLPPVFSFGVSDPLDGIALSVFIVVALIVTWQASRVRVQAEWARGRGTELEEVYQIAIRLLLLPADQAGGVPALRAFRDVLGCSAVCLFDAATIEISTDGASHYNLPYQTRQAYISGRDGDDPERRVFVRCLKSGNVTLGAIGFEGLQSLDTISPAIPVLAAAAVERARSFRRASHEIAAAQADTFRTAIVDAVAHEFKTPLATILAVIGGIRASGRLDSEQEEMAGMIESEVSRLDRLSMRLLRTARLDREEMKPRLETVDLVPFVERVVHRYTAHNQERRVPLDSSSEWIEAMADRQLLELAITQLLDNAFKYSPASSPITVSIREEEQSLAISVRNEGNSIGPGERERIFDRFYRGLRVRKLVSGTGLGLHIARRIAEAHGGSLELEDRDRGGSVIFCLRLRRYQSSKLRHERDTLVTTV